MECRCSELRRRIFSSCGGDAEESSAYETAFVRCIQRQCSESPPEQDLLPSTAKALRLAVASAQIDGGQVSLGTDSAVPAMTVEVEGRTVVVWAGRSQQGLPTSSFVCGPTGFCATEITSLRRVDNAFATCGAAWFEVGASACSCENHQEAVIASVDDALVVAVCRAIEQNMSSAEGRRSLVRSFDVSVATVCSQLRSGSTLWVDSVLPAARNICEARRLSPVPEYEALAGSQVAKVVDRALARLGVLRSDDCTSNQHSGFLCELPLTSKALATRSSVAGYQWFALPHHSTPIGLDEVRRQLLSGCASEGLVDATLISALIPIARTDTAGSPRRRCAIEQEEAFVESGAAVALCERFIKRTGTVADPVEPPTLLAMATRRALRRIIGFCQSRLLASTAACTGDDFGAMVTLYHEAASRLIPAHDNEPLPISVARQTAPQLFHWLSAYAKCFEDSVNTWHIPTVSAGAANTLVSQFSAAANLTFVEVTESLQREQIRLSHVYEREGTMEWMRQTVRSGISADVVNGVVASAVAATASLRIAATVAGFRVRAKLRSRLGHLRRVQAVLRSFASVSHIVSVRRTLTGGRAFMMRRVLRGYAVRLSVARKQTAVASLLRHGRGLVARRTIGSLWLRRAVLVPTLLLQRVGRGFLKRKSSRSASISLIHRVCEGYFLRKHAGRALVEFQKHQADTAYASMTDGDGPSAFHALKQRNKELVIELAELNAELDSIMHMHTYAVVGKAGHSSAEARRNERRFRLVDTGSPPMNVLVPGPASDPKVSAARARLYGVRVRARKQPSPQKTGAKADGEPDIPSMLSQGALRTPRSNPLRRSSVSFAERSSESGTQSDAGSPTPRLLQQSATFHFTPRVVGELLSDASSHTTVVLPTAKELEDSIEQDNIDMAKSVQHLSTRIDVRSTAVVRRATAAIASGSFRPSTPPCTSKGDATPAFTPAFVESDPTPSEAAFGADDRAAISGYQRWMEDELLTVSDKLEVAASERKALLQALSSFEGPASPVSTSGSPGRAPKRQPTARRELGPLQRVPRRLDGPSSAARSTEMPLFVDGVKMPEAMRTGPPSASVDEYHSMASSIVHLRNRQSAAESTTRSAELLRKVYDRRAAQLQEKLDSQASIVRLLKPERPGASSHQRPVRSTGGVLWSPSRRDDAMRIDMDGARAAMKDWLIRADVVAAKQRRVIAAVERDVRDGREIRNAKRLLNKQV